MTEDLKPQAPDITPPCVILNEPQLAENIGSVARVMANFGLSELRLVRRCSVAGLRVVRATVLDAV